ncbi:MAG: relaxase/mobilization nuclease domain-containing protein [Oscillospiraceae bacterium]|nr:relaxase/mobilization nuclease domain-containing protein [Oscillospiraceae bacterium]
MRHIKGSGGSNGLKRSIAYIMNPAKTEDGLLIGGNAGTTPEEVSHVMMETKQEWDKTGGRQGYHFVISWKPGEVTKDQAYRIVGEFCERYLGDAYDYVYSIHTDQDHLHGHIVFNSVNRIDGYKYRYEKGDWEKYVQPVTDEICREHGLPVLADQRTGEPAKSYAEFKADKEGLPTLTKIVRADIDMMIRKADDYDDFLKNMRRLGYRIREGKYITYYPPGFQKGRRDKTLGEGYSREEITFRIRHKEMEKDMPHPVVEPETLSGMEVRLAPYSRVRLSSVQLVFVGRVHAIGHYLESKNPFAVKWYTVRKDAMEAGKLFEECMYLLEHDIRDVEDLKGREKFADRKEKNLIRRILNRADKEEVPVPDRYLEIKAD